MTVFRFSRFYLKVEKRNHTKVILNKTTEMSLSLGAVHLLHINFYIKVNNAKVC